MPCRSGYRPQFFYEEWDHEVIDIHFVEKELVYPGDAVVAEITLLHPDIDILYTLSPGVNFQVREGSRIIATGAITRILNLQENRKHHPLNERGRKIWEQQKAERARSREHS